MREITFVSLWIAGKISNSYKHYDYCLEKHCQRAFLIIATPDELNAALPSTSPTITKLSSTVR